MDAHRLLNELFLIAVRAAHPETVLRRRVAAIPEEERRRAILLGAGKASSQMARVVEETWGHMGRGVAVTRYGHQTACQGIEVLQAGHPLPDAASLGAAERILKRLSVPEPDDWYLCLLSGGASSLLCAPPPGVSLSEKRSLNELLLRSGASISEINCVRRHVSMIKGGRLAAACSPARLLTLAISDVPGDDPAIIASGPTVGDVTTRHDARSVLERYDLRVAPSILAWLDQPESESLKPQDPRLNAAQYETVASARVALDAAARAAEKRGVTTEILSDQIEGDARAVAKSMAAEIRRRPFRAEALLLLSGGETTVRVTGDGVGGRNVEFLLALTIELGRQARVFALAADTDGVDGGAEVAGASIDPSTLERAQKLGLDPHDFLRRNDAHTFFRLLGDQVITGPTGTNVNDFRAVLITASL